LDSRSRKSVEKPFKSRDGGHSETNSKHWGFGKKDKRENNFSIISIEKWRERAKFGESTLRRGRGQKGFPQIVNPAKMFGKQGAHGESVYYLFNGLRLAGIVSWHYPDEFHSVV